MATFGANGMRCLPAASHAAVGTPRQGPSALGPAAYRPLRGRSRLNLRGPRDRREKSPAGDDKSRGGRPLGVLTISSSSAAPLAGARHPSFGRRGFSPEGRELSPSSGRVRGAETKERALNSPPRPRKPPPLGDADVATVRALAALFEIAALCPEPPCKRSRACRAHGAPCLARLDADPGRFPNALCDGHPVTPLQL